MAVGPEMHQEYRVAGYQLLAHQNFEGCVRLSTKACPSLLPSVESADSPLTGWEDVTTLNVRTCTRKQKKKKQKESTNTFKIYMYILEVGNIANITITDYYVKLSQYLVLPQNYMLYFMNTSIYKILFRNIL